MTSLIEIPIGSISLDSVHEFISHRNRIPCQQLSQQGVIIRSCQQPKFLPMDACDWDYPQHVILTVSIVKQLLAVAEFMINQHGAAAVIVDFSSPGKRYISIANLTAQYTSREMAMIAKLRSKNSWMAMFCEILADEYPK